MKEKIVYKVDQVTTLDEMSFARVVGKAAANFVRDPIFSKMLRDAKEIAKLITVCLHYSLRKGLVFCARDEQGEIQGIAMWDNLEQNSITPKNGKKNSDIGVYVAALFHFSPRSIYRMIKLAHLTKKHHIKEKHYYLLLITAFASGAGSALLEDAKKRFTGYDLYLENSNPARNNAFYGKHGFMPLEKITWNTHTLLPMRRSALETACTMMQDETQKQDYL